MRVVIGIPTGKPGEPTAGHPPPEPSGSTHLVRIIRGTASHREIATKTAFRARSEIDHRPCSRAVEPARCILQRLPEESPRSKKRVIDLFQLEPISGRKTRSSQANDIKPGNSISPSRYAERRKVDADGGTALHQCKRAHAAKLMHKGVGRYENTVANDRMAGDRRTVAQDHTIADDDIVADMAVGHQEIVGPDNGFAFNLVRPMDRGLFADDVPVSEPEAGGFAAILEVLRRIPQHGAGMDDIVRTKSRVAGEVDERTDTAARPDNHVLVNHRHRADFDRRIKLCTRMNDGGRMNHRTER